MATDHLRRSITTHIRCNLSQDERWDGPDKGLIWSWERGRQKRSEEPELAKLAEAGVLVTLGWKGGVTKKKKAPVIWGSLHYLATWQGLRGEDLNIERGTERVIVCTKTKQAVRFGTPRPSDDEDELEQADTGEE